MLVPEGEDYDPYWAEEVGAVHMNYWSLQSDLTLRHLGELVGHGTEDDDCRVSCEDWYGDSRPFFVEDRVYALLGYELIEGLLAGQTISEVTRVNALDLIFTQR